ncbi:MAG: helicase-related protein, partial [Dokdonella sp.]
TKLGTEELANKLQARGFSAAAINGDMQQAQRERTIQQLKDGKLDILCATDVAARGLDVDRISHVINYDIPHDVEGYVHRIGRTGRAGRSGEAILFVTPREKRLLQTIERATKQKVEEMTLPSVDVVNDKRVNKFKQRISETLSTGDLGMFQNLIDSFEQEQNVPAREIAAALARMVQGDSPLLLQPPKRGDRYETEERPARGDRYERTPRPERSERAPRFERPESSDRQERPARPERSRPPSHEATTFEGDTRRQPRRDDRPRASEPGFETFRVEVGHDHGVKPGNIVGAIANEAGLDSKNIGRIDIRDDHSLIDLPEGMPSEIFRHLKKVWVSGQQLQIAPNRGGSESSAPPRPAARPAPRGKPAPAGDRGFDKPESGFAKPRRPRKPE